jgi:hypothetical protein
VPIPTWSVGQVLAAADVNSWFIPLVGIKSGDQTISSQTTLINDADMRVAVAANATYEFKVYLRYSSGTGQDWKSSFTVPASAFARFQRIGKDLSGNFGSINEQTDSGSVTSQGSGVGTMLNAQFYGVLVTSGSSGNFIFQWAQNTSGAFNTTLYANSYLIAQRIA